MRYEAKHSTFKNIAKNTTCFKNICKTLCWRHQLKWNGTPDIYGFTFGPESKCLNNAVAKWATEEKIYLSNIIIVKWVEYKYIKYTKGLYVMIKLDTEKLPVFGKIESMFGYDGKGFLVYKSWKATQYDEFYQAYQIKESNDPITIISIETLLYYNCIYEGHTPYETNDIYICNKYEYIIL